MTTRAKVLSLVFLFGLAIAFNSVMAYLWPHKDCIQIGEYTCE